MLAGPNEGSTPSESISYDFEYSRSLLVVLGWKIKSILLGLLCLTCDEVVIESD